MLSFKDCILRFIYPEDFPKFTCPECKRNLYAYSRSEIRPEMCAGCSTDLTLALIRRILSNAK